jgi:hypothetical protein
MAASLWSGVAIHRLAANFGQPWCMLAVRQPKLGSSPTGARIDAHEHLIGLLIVLMRAQVGGEVPGSGLPFFDRLILWDFSAIAATYNRPDWWPSYFIEIAPGMERSLFFRTPFDLQIAGFQIQFRLYSQQSSYCLPRSRVASTKGVLCETNLRKSVFIRGSELVRCRSFIRFARR